MSYKGKLEVGDVAVMLCLSGTKSFTYSETYFTVVGIEENRISLTENDQCAPLTPIPTSDFESFTVHEGEYGKTAKTQGVYERGIFYRFSVVCSPKDANLALKDLQKLAIAEITDYYQGWKASELLMQIHESYGRTFKVTEPEAFDSLVDEVQNVKPATNIELEVEESAHGGLALCVPIRIMVGNKLDENGFYGMADRFNDEISASTAPADVYPAAARYVKLLFT